jgi:NADP-dependent 3-hydroxy acid dehydrogenase YdfG
MGDDPHGAIGDALSGTVAMITGASSGIGRATALALAGEGAAVAVVGRRGERLERLAAEIGDGGGTALPVCADLSEPAQAGDAVERAVAELGRLDVFVGNAATLLPGPISKSPPEEWDRMLDLNLRGLLASLRAALPHLLAAAAESLRGVADLVAVGSTAGRRSEHNLGVYGATKSAVAALMESLRRELAAAAVRVALVEPGHTATELGLHGRPGIECGDGEVGVRPLDPADVADVIRYLVTRPSHVAVNDVSLRPVGQWV